MGRVTLRKAPLPLMRTKLVPALALAFGLAAIAVITLLQLHTSAARDAERKLANVETALTRLQSAPFQANAETGGDPQRARKTILTNQEAVDRTLADLEAGSPPAELAQISAPLAAYYDAIDQIYELGITVGYGREADLLATGSAESYVQIIALIDSAGAEYHRRASLSRGEAIVGSAGVILVLLGAFGFFYARSNRLERENKGLLVASRAEALTDSLTGLGNRRALLNDLETGIPAASEERELLLALFDLDGFKQYNDSFGHPAGDALLKRLGLRLAEAVDGRGKAYRLGGDEFCLLVEVGNGAGEVVGRAAKALSDSGDAFEIGCSYGTVLLPTEADLPEGALRISDQRMYGNKAARGSASRQSADVLLQVLDERTEGLLAHLHDVAELADLTGRELGLSEAEVGHLHSAAELHDIGKSAIPDAVLNKPAKLDPEEWEFIRRHTLIGERIVLAAPSLGQTAPLIRSSHERVDGAGYPDGLEGDQIPLGARIIAVCDAYHAMTSNRPYSEPISSEDAILELQRCAGGQFDPDVVRAFRAVSERREGEKHLRAVA